MATMQDEQWLHGVNAFAFGRGQFHVLNEADHQIVGNLKIIDSVPKDILIRRHAAFHGTRGNRRARRDVVIAVLCGVSRGTVRN